MSCMPICSVVTACNIYIYISYHKSFCEMFICFKAINSFLKNYEHKCLVPSYPMSLG